MLLSGRPLLATAADRPFVVPRDEMPRVASAVTAGLNVLVLGAAGSGKTTLLHQVVAQLQEDGAVRALYLNARDLTDPPAVLTAVASMLPEVSWPIRPGPPGSDPAQDLVAALRPERRTVVVLDGLAPSVAHALFGRLRDELWQTDIAWVLAGDIDQRAQLLAPPADAFFESVVELAPLTPEQQHELITRRREPGDDDWADKVAVPSGNPRALLATLRSIAGSSEADATSVLVARVERQTRAEGLGRLHSMIHAELEDGAVVSAADEGFLDRFAISRQRAQQVLRDLEASGLAESATDRSRGGRPRKIYFGVGR